MTIDEYIKHFKLRNNNMEDNYKQATKIIQKMREEHGLENKLDEEVILLENIKKLWDKCMKDTNTK